MDSELALAQIAARWQQAVVDDGAWQAAVTALARALDAPGAAMFTPVIDAHAPVLTVAHGSAEHALPQYAAHWIVEDPWFRCMHESRIHHRAGTTQIGRTLLSHRAVERTGFYQDFARHHGIHDVLTLMICDGSGPHAPATRISFQRPAGARDFDTENQRLLQALWPHLQSAVEARWMLRRARAAPAASTSMLDMLPHPTWVLAGDCRVVLANSAALRVQRTRPKWLSLAGGRLLKVGDVDASTFRPALRPTQPEQLSLTAGCLMGQRLRRTTLQVVPIAPGFTLSDAWPGARAIVMFDVPIDDQQAWGRSFASHYRLTPAELRVLLAVAQGESLPSIANRFEVTHGTVRSQMRMLLEKTGCQRQTQLLRLFLDP